MVDREHHLGLAAILAGMAISGENLPASQLHGRHRSPNVVPEFYYRRTNELCRCRPDASRMSLQNLSFAFFDENESTSKMTDVQG
jgi:hypothetical protein